MSQMGAESLNLIILKRKWLAKGKYFDDDEIVKPIKFTFFHEMGVYLDCNDKELLQCCPQTFIFFEIQNWHNYHEFDFMINLRNVALNFLSKFYQIK